MATVIASGVHFFRAIAAPGAPVTVTPSWNSRLAGHAYVDASPMVGIVLAIDINGPTIVGVTEVQGDASFEILNIAQKHSTKELLVIGISRTPTDNIAVVGKILTVA